MSLLICLMGLSCSALHQDYQRVKDGQNYIIIASAACQLHYIVVSGYL